MYSDTNIRIINFDSEDAYGIFSRRAGGAYGLEYYLR